MSFVFDGVDEETYTKKDRVVKTIEILENMPADNGQYSYVSTDKLAELTGYSVYSFRNRIDADLSEYTFIRNGKRWWGKKEAVQAWHNRAK